MLENNVLEHLAHLRETLLGLSKIDSVTPPSDTREIVRFVAEQLRGLNNVDFKIYSEKAPIENIVAHVKGNGPGKHLMLNGHLDTFEVVQKENWKHDPFGGEVENGRLYGVGVSDMKAGCASLLETFILLAEHPDKWCGEVTLMLVGGEEAGGRYGTQYLLQSHPEWQKVDACLIADVGSSRVIRYGEKGRYRFKMMAHGIPGDRVIQPGDVVNIDVSAVKDGFFSDNGRSYALPPVKHTTQKLLDVCQSARAKAIAAAIAGQPLSMVGLAVEKEAHRHGLKTIRNLCGHGVGHTLHDDPDSVYNYYERRDRRILKPGLVIAIEPFICADDDYVEEMADGWTLKTPRRRQVVQFEHTVMVREGKPPLILTLLD